MYSKRKVYRNQAIRDAAKGEQCTLESPACNHDSSTVVFCHLNEHFAGKGFGQKAADIGFFGCSACHNLYDRRTNPSKECMIYVESEYFYVLRAVFNTIIRLLDKGVIK